MISKVIIPVFAILGLVFSCAPSKKVAATARPQKIELVSNDQDSTEYELIIDDAGFESWFEMHRKPVWYHSKEYLETWNLRYVEAWNAKVRHPFFGENDAGSPFILEINYRPEIDYGLDLNYKLYYYFKFIEATWGRILPFDRQN